MVRGAPGERAPERQAGVTVSRRCRPGGDDIRPQTNGTRRHLGQTRMALLDHRLGLALRPVVLRDEDVERGDDEEREQRSDGHAADEDDADRVSRDRARAGDEREREVSRDGRDGRHQDRTKARRGRRAHRFELAHSQLLLGVRELDDENSVLRHETDERDQPDLGVDVERRRPALR